MAEDFNCIRKAPEDEEDGATNNQEMESEKQAQPPPTEPSLGEPS